MKSTLLFLLGIGLLSYFFLKDEIWLDECLFPYDIGSIEILPIRSNNALRTIFSVQTGSVTDAYINYWYYEPQEDGSLDSVQFNSPLSVDASDHEIMLINVRPSTKYKFRVVVQGDYCKTYSNVYDFKSNNLPAWAPYYQKKDSLKDVSFEGVIHFHQRENPGYLFLADDQGAIVWYQKTPLNVKVSRFTQNNTFLTILSDDTLKYSSGARIVEVDLYGQKTLDLNLGDVDFDKVVHHEIFYDNDNIVSLTIDDKIFDLTSIGGHKQDTVRGDGIVILNKKGEKIWEWSTFDVVSPLDYDSLLNRKKDLFHANALAKDAEGNFLISFRNINQIWKVDGKTGALIWKLGGDNSDFEMEKGTQFYGQHNIKLDKRSLITLLDNGNKKKGQRNLTERKKNKRRIDEAQSKKEKMSIMTEINRDKMLNSKSKSRLIILQLDVNSMSVSLKEEVLFPEKYYTKSQGSVNFINDSLLMYCSTNTRRILFTDQHGEKKGFIPLQLNSYRSQYIPELYHEEYVK